MRLASGRPGIYVQGMKLRALFAGMGLLAASAGLAQTVAPPLPNGQKSIPAAPADADATKDPSKVGPAPKADAPSAKKEDAAKAAAKKAPPPAKKKEEPVPVVAGLAITRATGGFIGLQVVNSNFVLTFYDAKKKKIAPDVVRAAL